MRLTIVIFLCVHLYAQDSRLKTYLGLTDGQLQQINRALRPDVQPPAPGPPRRVYLYAGRPTLPDQTVSRDAILILTDAQKTMLPALEEALQLQLARLGAISLRLIDAPQETTGCWCTAEDAFAKYLGLTDAHRAELRSRLSVLPPEQRLKFEAIRTRSRLVDAADEAARLRLIPDPIPRGECLCN